MHKGKRILALIPARGGSKGLPGKNIRPMLGKPLIAWSVEHALEAGCADKVLVSTDSAEAAAAAKAAGAEVPFLRPAELAADTASSAEVILHAVDFLEKRGEKFDTLVLLEPTSPLREPGDITAALDLLAAHTSATAVISVAKAEGSHPDFCVEIEPASKLISRPGQAGFMPKRRQEIKDLYYFEGTIYVSDIETFKAKRTFVHEGTLGYEVPRWKAVEIDELSDFICAEALLKARREKII